MKINGELDPVVEAVRDDLRSASPSTASRWLAPT